MGKDRGSGEGIGKSGGTWNSQQYLRSLSTGGKGWELVQLETSISKGVQMQ